jgi:hypothetical protein
MKRRIERAPLPDSTTLRGLLGAVPSGVREGAVLVDGDARGASGFDLLMVDGAGRPLLVDIVTERPEAATARVFEHLAWLDENERLFFRAYGADGLREGGRPEIVFIAGAFPEGVVRSLRALADTAVRLVRAEYLLIDGEGELLLEEVAATEAARESGSAQRVAAAEAHEGEADADPGVDEEPASPSAEALDVESVAARQQVDAGEPGSGSRPSFGLEDRIESDVVGGLLRLFRSGVDGLDARIVEEESNGGVSYVLEGRTLARLSASAGSFTVTPGDRSANPIVVSDRVSLERALNAVVSLFVREEQSAPSAYAGDEPVDESEREELLSIWGGGVSGGEN